MSTITEIHANGIDIDNRVIYLSGDAPVQNEEPGVDYRMAATFIKNINALSFGSKEPIFIQMSTIGGEWAYGMAIYDAIKICPCEVTITAYAWARSMSSIILQAADHRILMPSASFMVHWGTSSEEGHYLAVKSSVEFGIKTEKMMLDIYAEKCVHGNYFRSRGMTHDQVSDFISEKMEKKSDWWLTAAEAVDYGFADRVA